MYPYVFFSDESDSDVIFVAIHLIFLRLNILSLEDFKALVVSEHLSTVRSIVPS